MVVGETTNGNSNSQAPKSQPFEVAVARKLKNRSSKLMDTFLKLDFDGDGFVTRSDFKKSLHNIYGIDLTEEQMDAIFTRFAFFDESMISSTDEGVQLSGGTHHGIRYADFVKYIHATAMESPSSSDDYGSALNLHVTSENHLESTNPPKDAVTDELRHALIRKLNSHVSSERGGGNGMDTQLFLMMDTDRSGKVSPKQFQEWLTSVGMVLTDEQCKTILGSHYHPTGIDLREFVQVVDGLLTEECSTGAKPMPWESVDRERIRGKRQMENRT